LPLYRAFETLNQPIPQPEPEKPLDTAGSGFQLLADCREVDRRPDPSDPAKTIKTMAAIARLTDGRIVARSESGGAGNLPVFAYGPFDVATGLASLAPTPDVPGKFLQMQSTIRQTPFRTVQLNERLADCEQARFAAMWPQVASQLGVAPPSAIVPAFPVGPGCIFSPEGNIDFLPFYERHAIGDHGRFGNDAVDGPQEPLNADERFMVQTLPVSRQNFLAKSVRRGVVRSSFNYPCISLLTTVEIWTFLGLDGAAAQTIGFTNDH
jgi:hypothetical protein